MPRLAATCPSCGAGDGLVLESASVEGPDGTTADVDLGVRRRRWVEPVLIGGVALAIGIGAVATGGRSGQSLGGSPTSPSSTSAPSTTTDPTAPLAPTTTVESDRFTFEQLDGPLLAARTDAVLYGLSNDAEVVRIDVDSGEVTRRRLRGPRGERADGFSVLARDGVAILASPGGRGALTVPDGPASQTQWVSGRGARIIPAAGPEEVWRITSLDDGSAVGERLGLDGEAVGPQVDVPASATVLGDDGTGRLVAKAPGGTYLVDVAGIARIADGEPVAWNATRLVVTVCDPALVCAWRVIDRTTGLGRDVLLGGDLRPGIAASLSPDGRWLAQLSGASEGGLEVVDLDSSERRRLDSPVFDAWGFGYGAAGMWWSPAGGHLFWLDEVGRVNAWPVGGEPVVLDGAGRLPRLRSLSVAPRPLPPSTVGA